MRYLNKTTRSYGRGLSLIETVLSLLILGGALVALLNTVSVSRVSQAVAADRQFARLLAEDMLAEILMKDDYAESGLLGLELDEQLGGNSRRAFDDIDDYHNWSASPPVDIDGNAIDGAQGLTREVAVRRVDPASPNTAVSSDRGLLRIVVTVHRGGKILAELQSFRSDLWQSTEADF